MTFPTTPFASPEGRTSQDGSLEFAMWEARNGDVDYRLSANYGPVEVVDATFDLEKWGIGNNPSWRVVASQAMTIDGQPGKRIDYVSPEGTQAAMSVTTRYEGTVVTLSIYGPKGLTVESKEAKAFFDSFRFIR